MSHDHVSNHMFTCLVTRSHLTLMYTIVFTYAPPTVCACVVRDAYVSYTIVDKCCQQLGSNTDILKTRGIDLSCIRTCVVVTEERPRTSLLNSFTALFSPLGLTSHAHSTSFGCRVNPIICLQVLECYSLLGRI